MPETSAGASTLVRPLSFQSVQASPVAGVTWRQRAICLGEDPDVFFPAHGDPGIRARQICARCPVRVGCREHAVANDEWGIWGGLDREQRRALCDGTGEAAHG
jgi:WhiB family redox-sensing transcriptional regulator